VRAAGARGQSGHRKAAARGGNGDAATAIDVAIQEQSAAFERIRKNLVLMKWGLVFVIIEVLIPLLKPYWMQASLH